MGERAPTDYEAAGMAWWNALSKEERAGWLSKTETGTVREAWEAFLDHEAMCEELNAESKARIDAASVATDQIFDLVGNALNGLKEQFEGRVINGAGVHRDPSQARRSVAAAIDELKKSLALFDATAWPIEGDYNDV